VDLLEVLTNTEELQKLADRTKMLEVVWLGIAPQADAASVTQDDFWHALDSKVIHEAWEAMLEGIVLFFRPEEQIALRACLDRIREFDEKRMKLATKKAQSPLLGKAVETELQRLEKRLDEQLESAITTQTSGA
jgi:hypothetical protein